MQLIEDADGCSAGLQRLRVKVRQRCLQEGNQLLHTLGVFALYVLAVWREVSQSSECSSVESTAAAATTRLQPSSTECVQEGEQPTQFLLRPLVFIIEVT